MNTTVQLNAAPGRAPAPVSAGVRRWAVFALCVAGLISVPVLVVASSVFVSTGDIWAHLAATVLPRYVANSLWLLAGVGIGSTVAARWAQISPVVSWWRSGGETMLIGLAAAGIAYLIGFWLRSLV